MFKFKELYELGEEIKKNIGMLSIHKPKLEIENYIGES